MLSICKSSMLRILTVAALVFVIGGLAPVSMQAKKKKKDLIAAPASTEKIDIPDFTKIVFPPAPSVPRVRFLDFYSAMLPDEPVVHKKQKAQWMDRLAGVDPEEQQRIKEKKPLYQLFAPYGVAVDSKGLLYVADTKVGAIFIFDTENDKVELIHNHNGVDFKVLLGLAMDDADHLFVSDYARHEILEFDQNHKFVGSFGSTDLRGPCGLALDQENRFLYVVDTEADQVVVFDADSHAVLRKIGTAGKNHTLRDPGDFSKPTNVAVDQDGNVYVTDTLNDRVEVFDADGNFIRTFGQNGDAVGNFERPKGIAIDSDGHVWVADAMLNRVQIFTPEGQPLMAFGGYGIQPAQFQALTGVCFDAKRHRIFVAGQLYARVQMFQYYTDDEARAEIAKRRAGKAATTGEGAKETPAKEGEAKAVPAAQAGAETPASAVSKP